jgi:hypothetical protein
MELRPVSLSLGILGRESETCCLQADCVIFPRICSREERKSKYNKKDDDDNDYRNDRNEAREEKLRQQVDRVTRVTARACVDSDTYVVVVVVVVVYTAVVYTVQYYNNYLGPGRQDSDDTVGGEEI